jgi:hypothetical protein
MTLVFILIVVTVMLMMIQKLVARIQPGSETSATPDIVGSDRDLNPTKLKVIMQLLITVVGLAGGGYILLYGDYPVAVQYWAAGLVGSVVGFWLK